MHWKCGGVVSETEIGGEKARDRDWTPLKMTRVRQQFLWLPVSIGGEVRWLVWVLIREALWRHRYTTILIPSYGPEDCVKDVWLPLGWGFAESMIP